MELKHAAPVRNYNQDIIIVNRFEIIKPKQFNLFVSASRM